MDPDDFCQFDERSLSKGESRRQPLDPHQYDIFPYNCIGLITCYLMGK